MQQDCINHRTAEASQLREPRRVPIWQARRIRLRLNKLALINKLPNKPRSPADHFINSMLSQLAIAVRVRNSIIIKTHRKKKTSGSASSVNMKASSTNHQKL